MTPMVRSPRQLFSPPMVPAFHEFAAEIAGEKPEKSGTDQPGSVRAGEPSLWIEWQWQNVRVGGDSCPGVRSFVPESADEFRDSSGGGGSNHLWPGFAGQCFS